MAIKTAPKEPSAHPAKVRPAVARTKPAIAPPLVNHTVKSYGSNRPGRPPSGKVRVTILLKPETIAKFKATGPGWQARISDILDAAKV